MNLWERTLKLKSLFNQLSLFNVFLFLVLFAAVEYPFWNVDLLGMRYSTYWAMALLAVWIVLLAVETIMVFKLETKGSKPFLTSLFLTHLPWLLGFAKPLFI